MHASIRFILPGLFSLLALYGCTSQTMQEAPQPVPGVITMSREQRLGQSFVGEYDGLNQIRLYLIPVDVTRGRLILRLRKGSWEAQVIATAMLSLSQVREPGFYTFRLDPQPNSRSEYYFLELELQGEGAVSVGIQPAENYYEGSMYLDQEPVDENLLFRVNYDPLYAAVGLAGEFLAWLEIGVAGVLLFIVPGYALLSFTAPDTRGLPSVDKLALSLGLSLPMYPLILLWSDALGIRPGRLTAWLPIGMGLGMIVWKNRKKKSSLSSIGFRQWLTSSELMPTVALALLALILFISRMLAARDLEAGMWGDSYQHTLIAQLILEHEGLFQSWEPYAELTSFTYHFGFHAAVATFAWLTGLSSINATIWVGQLVNVLAILALYPWARRIGGNSWAGVATVLVAGLLSQMPNFYTNWGRYTQLAGQIILPASMLFIWLLAQRTLSTVEGVALTSLSLAGLFLTHYRVAILAVLFLLPAYLFSLRKHTLKRDLSQIGLVLMAASLMVSPWILTVIGSRLMDWMAGLLATAPSSTPAHIIQYNSIGPLSYYAPPLLWGLALLAAVWGLWQRRKEVLLLTVWWILVVFSANPSWFGLPGTGVMSNFAVFIGSYVPVGILCGVLIGWLSGWPRFRLFPALWILIAVLLGLWGAKKRIDEIDPARYALITRPDVRAYEWIRKNTPPDSKFLVNSFLAHGGTLVVGSDGGWWIPLFAQRKTTLPPLTYSFEEISPPGSIDYVNYPTRVLQEKGPQDQEFIDLLLERGVTHAYIGQKQGRVNYSGPHVLNPMFLLNHPAFDLRYHEDRVWIFELAR
jgi:hypothetical protein